MYMFEFLDLGPSLYFTWLFLRKLMRNPFSSKVSFRKMAWLVGKEYLARLPCLLASTGSWDAHAGHMFTALEPIFDGYCESCAPKRL